MPLPPLPERDKHGNRPAVAMARVLLARRVIRAREAMGLSRRELAKQTGVAADTLARLEVGRHMPRSTTIEKLRRILGKL